MANPSDRGRKLLVRTALATGVTLATLIGAQNLAMLDQRRFALSQTPAGNPELILLPPPDQSGDVVGLVSDQSSGSSEIQHVTPNLVILRQPGVINAATTPSANIPSNGAILPPQPVELAAPPPVIVEQPGEVIVQQAAPAGAPAVDAPVVAAPAPAPAPAQSQSSRS